MDIAKAKDIVRIFEVQHLPNGRKCILTPCSYHEEYMRLPNACTYKGEVYVRTGWNSDTGVAYFKTGVEYAEPA